MGLIVSKQGAFPPKTDLFGHTAIEQRCGIKASETRLPRRSSLSSIPFKSGAVRFQ